MLESLYIKNYRLFRELRIDSLKRVNLIIGKNNAGKSSLLEAIATYLGRDEIALRIYRISCDRREWVKDNFKLAAILNSLTTLFYDRKFTFNESNDAIYIGNDEQRGISFHLSNTDSNNRKTKPALIITDNNKKVEEILLSDFENHILMPPSVTNHEIVPPTPSSDVFNRLALDWGKIALTDKEDYVIETLQIIDRNIERLTFIDETPTAKRPIVRLRDMSQPVTLASMGDGIVRIFRIIVTLVCCENGTLLIDEFETGLHWSVQAELWEFIYLMAEKFNVQIFASTHSRDTLWALQQVALSKGAEDETSIIKLLPLPKKRKIKAVEVDVENVKLALEQELEIR